MKAKLASMSPEQKKKAQAKEAAAKAKAAAKAETSKPADFAGEGCCGGRAAAID